MRLLKEIIIMALCIGFGIIIHGSVQAWKESYEMPTEPEVITEYVYIESEPEVITEYVYIPYQEDFFLNLTNEECNLLEQIAYAEAKGEGTIGMMLVMNVVINRSKESGKSIKEVIYAPGQFYTAGMTPNVSEECHEALALVLDGLDESQGALFFNKYGYRKDCEPLFQYKNHYFSK